MLIRWSFPLVFNLFTRYCFWKFNFRRCYTPALYGTISFKKEKFYYTSFFEKFAAYSYYDNLPVSERKLNVYKKFARRLRAASLSI